MEPIDHWSEYWSEHSNHSDNQVSYWADIKADTYRQYGHFSMAALIKGFLLRRNFRVVITMRLCQAAAAATMPWRLCLPFLQILHRLASNGACMDFPWRTQIGGGLALTHGWGLVINQTAQIGRNVTLFHGVTLGQRDRIADTGERYVEFPVIEDEVWIGPHAIIVGGVRIGRGSRIAGGAFVKESIPPYSVVAGNPAVIVKSGCVADVSNPAVFD
ncbi:MAG TPA: serine acetyltransferase [Rhodocyclaceae bacterium]|nr:serine acetyltransferase [Rhodocyclaceae bacterium]